MVAGILSAVLLLPGVPPHNLGEHCARIAVAEAGHHAAGHGALPNNTPGHPSDPCPHCPPAQCASESSCGSPVLGLLPGLVFAPPVAHAALPVQVAARLRPHSTQPPTPPPQVLLRFV